MSEVLDAFFHDPTLSISEIESQAGVAYHTARSALQELEDRGLVYEITGRKRGKVYACAPILEAIFSP
jgi:Fic family protein